MANKAIKTFITKKLGEKMQKLWSKENIFITPVKTQTNSLGFSMSTCRHRTTDTGVFYLPCLRATRLGVQARYLLSRVSNRWYKAGFFLSLQDAEGLKYRVKNRVPVKPAHKKEGITEVIKAAYNRSALTSISRIRLYPERTKDISIGNMNA